MVGIRLKKERERLGLTQAELGRLAGVDGRSVRNYEKGERTPDIAYLAAIARAGADVLYVLTGVRLPEIWRDQVIRVLRTTAAVEPEGGRLTELALQGIAGMVAEESADYGELSTDERQLLALFRRADLTHKMRAVAELEQGVEELKKSKGYVVSGAKSVLKTHLKPGKTGKKPVLPEREPAPAGQIRI